MQQSSVWQAVLGEIELSVSHGNFVTWFKNTQLLQLTDDSLVIGVVNVFMKQQLQVKYADLILQTLQKHGINPKTIEYKIVSSQKTKPETEETLLQTASASGVRSATTAAAPAQ